MINPRIAHPETPGIAKSLQSSFIFIFIQKTSGEASTGFGPNHHYLQRIIEIIENTPLIALYHNVSLFISELGINDVFKTYL